MGLPEVALRPMASVSQEDPTASLFDQKAIASSTGSVLNRKVTT